MEAGKDRLVASQFIDIHLDVEDVEVVRLEVTILTLTVPDDFCMRLEEHAQGIAVGSSRDAGVVHAVVIESQTGCHDGLYFLQ